MFGYIILQFIWWEILLVKQNNSIIEQKQKLLELSISNDSDLIFQVKELHAKKLKQTLMIVGEGTVFLLLLLYGIFKIKQAHDREDKLTQQKNNFLLSITHELKTPIAATKLQLQTLLKHQLDTEKQKELLQHALTENERINQLIDNVLLANQLNSGGFKLNKSNINFSQVISNCCNRYYSDLISKKQLELSIQSDIHLIADENAVISILTNLINNAIKYSHDNVKINVELYKGKDETELLIKDNGIGIPKEDGENIFKPFYRVGSEETRTTKGSGLGLYIVSYLCELSKFKVSFYPNQPKGTVFKIECQN